MAQDSASASSGEASSSAAAAAPIVPIAGKGVLVIDETLLALTLKQHPASYTGALTTITVKMGEKLRDDGLADLKPHFSEGVETATKAQDGAYNIALRLDGFSYKYDSMSSMGFAVTPRVTLTVTADITSPSGAVLLHKSYTRTDFTAGHYIATFKPTEKVMGSLDKALSEIYTEMATDISAAASTTPASAASAAPVSASSSSVSSSSFSSSGVSSSGGSSASASAEP